MSKKVHMKDYNYVNTIACNRNITYIGGKEFSEFEKLPEEKQCKSCLKTKAYIEAKAKLESERELESWEFEVPKTQLVFDTLKYNLSKEHVDILSGVDYEVVDYDVINNTCKNCVFQQKCRFEYVTVSCRKGLNNGEEDIIFKQVHKTQESFNKSIENEGLKDIKVPFSEDVTHGSGDLKSTMIKIDTTNLQRAAKETIEKMGESTKQAMKDFGDNMQAKRKGDSNEQNSDHYKDTPDKYKFTINNRNGESIVCDVYDLIESLKITNSAHQHGFKKIVNTGNRGFKDFQQDMTEAIQSFEIARVMNNNKKEM